MPTSGRGSARPIWFMDVLPSPVWGAVHSVAIPGSSLHHSVIMATATMSLPPSHAHPATRMLLLRCKGTSLVGNSRKGSKPALESRPICRICAGSLWIASRAHVSAPSHRCILAVKASVNKARGGKDRESVCLCVCVDILQTVDGVRASACEVFFPSSPEREREREREWRDRER